MKSLPYKLALTLLVTTLPLFGLRAEPGAGGPAAPASGTKTGAETGEGKPRKDAGERMKERGAEIKEQLGLSDEQSEKIGAIMKENFEAMKTVKDDASLTQDDKRAKLKEMHQASDAKITAILTPEQVTKYNEIKQQRMEKMKEKRQEKKEAKP